MVENSCTKLNNNVIPSQRRRISSAYYVQNANHVDNLTVVISSAAEKSHNSELKKRAGRLNRPFAVQLSTHSKNIGGGVFPNI
jgi:hypothetical protein